MSNVPVVSEFLQSDIENVYYFLISNKYPLAKDISIDVWTSIFNKQWMLGKTGNGFLLKKDDEIVGVLWVYCCVFYCLVLFVLLEVCIGDIEYTFIP